MDFSQAEMGTSQTRRRNRRVAGGRSRQSGLPEGEGRSAIGMKMDEAGSIAEEREGVGAHRGTGRRITSLSQTGQQKRKRDKTRQRSRSAQRG